MARVERVNHPGMEAYVFECPGCGMDHMVVVSRTPEYAKACMDAGRGNPCWSFNGDLNMPTFNPSLLVREYMDDKVVRVCHSFIRNGQIQFLSDCTHALANLTVNLSEVEQNGQTQA